MPYHQGFRFARQAADRAANAQGKAERGAGLSAARAIRTATQPTPAAQYAGETRGAVATTQVENTVQAFLQTGTGGAIRMRDLVQSVKDDPDALAGLRKAGVDWIVRNHVDSGTGLLSAAKLIGFLGKNRDTLRELYSHDQLAMMGAVARDAEVAARWRTETAVKGGSDSLKNLLAALSEAGKANGKHVTLGVVAVEAISQGLEHAGVKGAAYAGAGAAAAYLINTFRQAGIRNTAQLYRDAPLDPELARSLISMPTNPQAGALHNFARVVRRSLIVGPTLAGKSAPTTGATQEASLGRGGPPARAAPARAVSEISSEAVPANGNRGENRSSARALRGLPGPKPAGGLAAIDRLLEDGTFEAHHHAAALAYAALRRRCERSGGPMRSWQVRSKIDVIIQLICMKRS